MPPPLARRLADLLIDPHENLDVELKNWLDTTGNNDHKATLAKALVALANHGGGFLIFGFTRSEDGRVSESAGRPATLAAYNSDIVNGIVAAYAEPIFHCHVSIAVAPSGGEYPVVSVPGGHHAPIRTKRDGPNGQIVRANQYYIRRPGPQSEPPQSGREWDALIRRTISNAKEDLLSQMRSILAGAPATETPPDERELLNRWFTQSLTRWREVTGGLAPTNSATFPRGHVAYAYRLTGVNLVELTATQLLASLNNAVVRHTGWPEFWVPTNPEIKPYLHDGVVECWIARDGKDHGPFHSDFWRASPNGQFFLIRGHQEDEAHEQPNWPPPGSTFDITLPSWRVAELLLHAAAMAGELGDTTANVSFLVEWTGLRGRDLAHLERRRTMFEGHRSQQDVYQAHLTVQANQISTSLPELTMRIIRPLYELFDFFQLPAALPSEEIALMRSHRF
jgi:hypothetical protein